MTQRVYRQVGRQVKKGDTMNKNKLVQTTIGAIGGLVTLAGIGYLIWQAMLHVPPNAARLWAILVTGALPLVAWASWWFGHTEARGRLAGIDQAVDRVMGAASKTAGLRVETVRSAKSAQSTLPAVILPDVEIMPILPSNQIEML